MFEFFVFEKFFFLWFVEKEKEKEKVICGEWLLWGEWVISGW